MLVKLNLMIPEMTSGGIEIDDGATVSQLKHEIHLRTAIPAVEQELYLHDKVIGDASTLRELGAGSGDVIAVYTKKDGGQNQAYQTLLRRLLSEPQVLQLLPEALQARLHAQDLDAVPEALSHIHAHQAAQQYAEIDELNADEFDPEAQAKIAERIKKANIEANWSAALEHSPEVFGQISMLYVNLEVNKQPLKTFVDSGAQQCVMSLKCAEKCNIAYLIDTRYQGILKGVGFQKMYGRVHSVQVKVGTELVPMAVTVVEHSDMDLLFGLDMLRRYRCNIDLDNNCLRFGSLNVSLPFLPDHEIPQHAPVENPAAAGGSAAAAGRSTPSVAPGLPQADPSTATAGAPGPSTSAVPPTTAAAPQRQASGPPGAVQGSAKEENSVSADVQQLMSLGFPKQMCEEALKMCGGSVDHAASLLFSQ